MNALAGKPLIVGRLRRLEGLIHAIPIPNLLQSERLLLSLSLTLYLLYRAKGCLGIVNLIQKRKPDITLHLTTLEIVKAITPYYC